jgi:ribose-phosphate pyrophosphokinase
LRSNRTKLSVVELIIAFGSSGEHLARAVAKITRFSVTETETRRFPDGELYVRVMGDASREDVAVFQSLGMRPDRLLMEYCLIADAVKGMGCKTVTAVIPYLAYARQDARFRSGEPLSIKLVARSLEGAGTDRLISVDAHLHRLRALKEVFTIPTLNLSAMPLLAEYYKMEFGARNVIVVGPDSESEQWASTVAGTLSTEYSILNKERLGDRDVEISGSPSVRGKTVVLVDDIISTGKTLVGAIRKLRSKGAKRIDVLTTHALLVEGALSLLRKAGMSHLVSTDTIPRSTSRVSVAPMIADALREWK